MRAGLAASGQVKRIFGMRHGVRGLVKPGAEGLLDLTEIDKAKLEAVARTPSAALGSTRDKPDEAYCEKILDGCRRNDIRYFFYIGGNDSADTCRIVSEKARSRRLRAPLLPRAEDHRQRSARERPHAGLPLRRALRDARADGRCARQCEPRRHQDQRHHGAERGLPHRRRVAGARAGGERRGPGRPAGAASRSICPEVPFSTDAFLADVEAVYAKLGRCQIAVSEGIRDATGAEIGPKLMRGAGEVDAHGNVQLSGSGALGDGLADLVKTGLTPKGGKAPRVRADTFGYIQRCWPEPSPVDMAEARAVGRYAAELAARGDASASVIIVRTSNAPDAYRSECARADLSAVARRTRHVPAEFISGSNDVSAAFDAYCRPLVGESAEAASGCRCRAVRIDASRA